MFGLYKEDITYITNLLAHYPAVTKAVIFGSRAMGNYRQGSDVDIALFGKELTTDEVSAISFNLNEESPMPYFFDVLHFDKLKKEALKDHIRAKGKLLYEPEGKEVPT